jgi:hypothetical protein
VVVEKRQTKSDICRLAILTPHFSHKFTFLCCKCFASVVVVVVVVAVARAHGGEWFCEVGRCVVKTNSIVVDTAHQENGGE